MTSVLMISVRADWGGGPEHVYRLIKNFPPNIKPYIACPNEQPYWNRYSKILGQDKMIEIPHRKFKISSMLKIKRFIRQNNIQLIHSHGKGAGLYSRPLSIMTNVPCVHTFHGIHIAEYSLIKKAAYLFLERMLAIASSGLISVSESEAQQVKKLSISTPKKLSVIPNGVRIPDDYNKSEYRHNDKFTIIHITRFDYAKNFELIFDIWRHLEKKKLAGKLELFVIGQGPDKDIYQNEVKKNNWQDKIYFTGPVQNTQDYFCKAFCYLSTSRWEGMPLAVLEAMAMGVPVVATDVVGNRDVVENAITGLLFNPKKPDQAANQIEKLLNDRTEWQNLSRESRLRACNLYSAEKMALNTEKVYSKILNTSGKIKK